MLAKQYRIVALFRHFCPRALNHKLLFYQTETSKLEEHKQIGWTQLRRLSPVRVGVMECLGLSRKKTEKICYS